MTEPVKRKWFCVALLSSAIFSVLFFFPVVYYAGQIIPSLGDDSVKNVFTYLFQIKYGNGLWFKGMNYPWGDNVAYADCQMLYSFILSSFRNRVSPESAMGLMWGCILASYSLCMLYIYCILNYFKVKPLLAITFAALITFMSPQIVKVWGHYGLSYAFVVPCLFYYTLLYHDEQQKNRYKYILYLAILFAYMFLIHMYFVLIITVWVGLYCFGYAILEKNTIARKIAHIVPMISGLAVMAGLAIFFLKVNEHINDRPTLPWGTLSWVTHPKQIFATKYSPIWRLIAGKRHANLFHSGDEGMIYLGVVTIIVTLAALLLIFKNIIVRKNRTIQPGVPKIWIFIGIIALCIGMGIPFIFKMEFLLDYMSFLRQFRCLGRVSWIFYYIISINTAIFIGAKYHSLVKSGKLILGLGLITLTILLWGTEVYGYNQYIRNVLRAGNKNYRHFMCKNEKNWTEYLAEKQMKGGDFQAALVFPYSEIGTEKLTIGLEPFTDSPANTAAFKVSYQLNLPLINNIMSRASWSHAFSRVKLIGGPFTDKSYLDSLPNSKPILLLVLDKWTADPDYQYMIQQADTIGHFQNCTVYKLSIDKLKKNYVENTSNIKIKTSNLKDGDTCIAYGGPWIANHFDLKETPLNFFGGGVSMVKNKITDTLFRGDLVGPLVDTNYEFSIWTLATPKDYKTAYFRIFIYGIDGAILEIVNVEASTSTDNIGMWLRASGFFVMPRGAKTISVFGAKLQYGHEYIAVDEMLLRPVSGTIVSKDKHHRILVNNHLIKE